MKRKTKKTVTAILSADWHIRGDRPVCRTDDYMEAQKKKIEFILSLATKYDCPILIAGDFGHRAIWGDRLLKWTQDIISPNLQDNAHLFITPGQHDLINHRIDKATEAGLGVLQSNQISILAEYNINYGKFLLYSFPYSVKLKDITIKERKDKNVALCHMMVIQSQKDKLWEAQEAHSAKWYLKKFPCYDLIVTGDNHQSFVVEYEGRLLVNPGSLMRMSANQIDHRPSVYLWYAEDNKVERVYLPIEKDVISREHIEVAEERNSRIESFVNRLKETEELGLSFPKNMKEFLKVNKVKKRITEKIWEAIE